MILTDYSKSIRRMKKYSSISKNEFKNNKIIPLVQNCDSGDEYCT